MEEPWLRRSDESDAAYACFGEFRDLPDRIRSARLLYEARARRGLTEPNERAIHRWRSQWDWIARAEAFDAHVDRAAVAALIKQREAAARRHGQIAVAMQAKIVARLQQINPEDLAPRDLAAWLRVAVEVERTALGMETTAKVEVSGPAGGPIELAAVRELSTDDRRALLAEAVRTASERLDRLKVIDGGA